MATIPNAFDRNAFFLDDKRVDQKGGLKLRYVIVSVGSLSENKGQRRVIEALIRLKKSGVTYRIEFIMVGGGDPKQVRYLLDLVQLQTFLLHTFRTFRRRN